MQIKYIVFNGVTFYIVLLILVLSLYKKYFLQILLMKHLIILMYYSYLTIVFPQAFNKEALVQEFDLIEGENLLGVERKRYPFYLHEHRESEWSKHLESGQLIQPMKNKDLYLDKEVLRLPITTHTVLDGCVLVTSYAVYEVRPW